MPAAALVELILPRRCQTSAWYSTYNSRSRISLYEIFENHGFSRNYRVGSVWIDAKAVRPVGKNENEWARQKYDCQFNRGHCVYPLNKGMTR